MDEISSQFNEISESSETRSVEQQSLDDATLRPGAYIEQNGDFQQAEAIQADLVDISENASSTGSDVGWSPLPLPMPEAGVLDSRQEVSATPINTPGQGKPVGDSPAETPERPGQLIDFEKPILNQEMEDLDQNLGSLDDIGSLIPGGGQLEGDLSGDLLGDLGFSGGPGDLKNEGGGPGSDPNDLFGPGGGPPGAEMLGIGGKGENIFWSWNFLPEQESSYTHAKELTEMQDASGGDTETIVYDSAWQAPPKGEKPDLNDDFAPATSADYAEREQEMTDFTNAQMRMETEKAEQEEARIKRETQSDTPDEGGDEYNRMQTSPQVGSANPKYDQDQISNYPEGHIADGQGEGRLSPEHAEQLKESLDAKAKREQSTPKVTTEQVTDPPEPEGGKKGAEIGKQGSG